MDLRNRINRFLETAVGSFRSFVEERKRSPGSKPVQGDGTAATVRADDAAGMGRVTDSMGNEFLCPLDRLKNRDFVKEEEKGNCFDYTTISTSNAVRP